MKLIILTLSLLLAWPMPGHAATPSGEQSAKVEEATAEKNDTSAEGAKNDEVEAKKEEKAENEFSCDYYKVVLPDGWKAVKAPVVEQGMTNAIFASNSEDAVVTMIVGPRGDADGKTIADMFAEQFKSPKPPVQKNGQYTFSFPRQETTAYAWVSTEGDEFMITTITGNQKAAMNFIKKGISSEKYSGLLPK